MKCEECGYRWVSIDRKNKPAKCPRCNSDTNDDVKGSGNAIGGIMYFIVIMCAISLVVYIVTTIIEFIIKFWYVFLLAILGILTWKNFDKINKLISTISKGN